MPDIHPSRNVEPYASSRHRWLGTTTLALLVLLLASPALPLPLTAQDVDPGDEESITIRGILSAVLFANDQLFGPGNGQNALWAELPELDEDPWYHDADVRGTRVGLDFHGPRAFGEWRAGGTVEVDFFAGFAGAGTLSDEQPTLRLRLAYADLTNGRTTLRVGQAWSPTFGFVPQSISHVGFAPGWGGSGLIGWRFPGVFLYHDLETDGPTAFQVQLAAFRGSWSDEAESGGVSAGEATRTPQFEARLGASQAPADGTPWEAFVAGHWDRKDLDGIGTDPDQTLDSWAVNGGLRVRPGPFTFLANGYVGHAVGHVFAQILQFGDFGGWGAQTQLGYALSPGWSIWGLYGIDDPNDEAPARLRNQTLAGLLRYGVGQYSVGLEWYRVMTDHRVGADAETSVTGNQIALGIRYDF